MRQLLLLKLFFFLLISVFIFQNVEAQTAYKVYDLKLTCLQTGEGGEDEVYLEVSIDGAPKVRYPGNTTYYSMDEDSKIAIWNIPYSFSYSKSCKITVKEYDDASGDDLIGEITIYNNTSNGTVELKEEGSSYKLSFKNAQQVTSTSARQPFKFIFNGIRCLETTDDGEDEVRISVQVDDQPRYIHSTYSMNERAQGSTEKGWDDLVGNAKKEYWLLPGTWYVKDHIRIFIEELDAGANPDDHIGEIYVSMNDEDKYNYFQEFTQEGHYFVSYTKETAVQRPSNIPANFTLMNPDIGTRTDAIADQGSEGACVAFSTTSAIASKVLNDYINKSANPVETRAKLASLTKPMFDAHWFYKLRQHMDGAAQDEGWMFPLALEKAKAVTLPFINGNNNYGIRLKNAYRISDRGIGEFSTKYYSSDNSSSSSENNLVPRDPGKTRQDLMREILLKKEVLLADFSVYEDFHSYVGSKGIYGGTIYQSGTEKTGLTLGHAVMVTGFSYPNADANAPFYWEIQNSWGRKWGNNGFCKFVSNACNVDDVMYFPGDYYVCDLQGNPVSQQEADRLIEEAINGALGIAIQPPLFTTSLLANKFIFIENLWKPNMRINVEKELTASARLDGEWSAHWKLIPIEGTEYYFIQNRWKEGRLNIEHGNLELSAINDEALSAHWKLVRKSDGTYSIENRWKPNERIHIEHGKLECGTIDDGANSALWYLKIVTK